MSDMNITTKMIINLVASWIILNYFTVLFLTVIMALISLQVIKCFTCRYQLVHRKGGKWRLRLHVSTCTTGQQTLSQIHLCVSGGTGAGGWWLPLQTRSVRREAFIHKTLRSHTFKMTDSPWIKAHLIPQIIFICKNFYDADLWWKLRIT